MVKCELSFHACVNTCSYLDAMRLIFNKFAFSFCVNRVSAIAGVEVSAYLCIDVSVMTLICKNRPRD